MIDRSIILSIGASLAAFFFVLELVRQRKLHEGYSLLWLVTAVTMLVLSVWRDGLHTLSTLVGIVYPPNLLFLVALLFVFFLLLYFSTVMTKLTRENKEIAQQVALLREEVRRLREEGAQDDQRD